MATNGVVSNDVNGHGEDKAFRQFLQKVFDVIMEEGVEKQINGSSKVVEFRHPKELRTKFNLEIGADRVSDQELLATCRDTIRYSVQTGHPHFFNQLFGGIDRYGLAGAWLSEAMNASAYTYEVAPVFTLMELSVLKKMRDIIGYTSGDGIFCPGGSMSNMYGVNLARYRKFPQAKTEGMAGLRLCMFYSNQAHYSLKKAAALLGIGSDNLIVIPTDEKGKMIPNELAAKVVEMKEKGYQPFFVNATAGTTVAGAFDPLDQIADICEKYDMWMHVDACWGGGALLSKKHKHKTAGIERADSVAWNAHKMMGTPLQCCAFLTKHDKMLQDAHCANAKYLFQQDKFYDVSYDTGDKSIQCGRKVDVFKLWLMWKSKGDLGYEKCMDNIFDQARYLADKVKETEGFELIFEPECTNVCFYYIPPSMRGQERTDEWWQQVAKVGPKVKERMVVEGTMLVGYQPLPGKVNFFRMVVSNLESTNADMDHVISEIQRLGQDL